MPWPNQPLIPSTTPKLILQNQQVQKNIEIGKRVFLVIGDEEDVLFP